MCTYDLTDHACMAGKSTVFCMYINKNKLYEIIHELESLTLSMAKFSQKWK